MTNKQFRKKLKKLKRNIRQYIVDKKLEKFFEKCEEVKVVEIKEIENSFFYCFDYKSDVSEDTRDFITSYISQIVIDDKEEKYSFCYSKLNTNFYLFENLDDMLFVTQSRFRTLEEIIKHNIKSDIHRKKMLSKTNHIFESEMN